MYCGMGRWTLKTKEEAEEKEKVTVKEIIKEKKGEIGRTKWQQTVAFYQLKIDVH